MSIPSPSSNFTPSRWSARTSSGNGSRSCRYGAIANLASPPGSTSLVVHRDVESTRGELPGTNEAGRARADDSDRIPISRTPSPNGSTAFERHIRRKALQSSDLDRLSSLVPEHARALAQHLDGTNPRTSATEQVLGENRRCCRISVVTRDRGHEAGHVHSSGARSHARGLGVRATAFEAPLRLDDRLGPRQRRDELFEDALSDVERLLPLPRVWSQAPRVTSGGLRTPIRGKAQHLLRARRPHRGLPASR